MSIGLILVEEQTWLKGMRPAAASRSAALLSQKHVPDFDNHILFATSTAKQRRWRLWLRHCIILAVVGDLVSIVVLLGSIVRSSLLRFSSRLDRRLFRSVFTMCGVIRRDGRLSTWLCRLRNLVLPTHDWRYLLSMAFDLGFGLLVRDLVAQLVNGHRDVLFLIHFLGRLCLGCTNNQLAWPRQRTFSTVTCSLR